MTNDQFNIALNNIPKKIATLCTQYGVLAHGVITEQNIGTFSFASRAKIPPEVILDIEIAISKIKLHLYHQAVRDFGTSPTLNKLIRSTQHEIIVLENSLDLYRNGASQTSFVEFLEGP